MNLGSPEGSAGDADVVDLRESSPRKHLSQHPSAPPLLRKRVLPVEVIEVLDSPAARKEGVQPRRGSCKLLHLSAILWVSAYTSGGCNLSM